MRLYKFIDEHTIKRYVGEYIHYNGKIYTNPSEEILKAAGYKELEEISELPYYNPSNQVIERRYNGEGSKIKTIFIIKERTDEDEREI